MQGDGYLVVVYIVYAAVALGLTTWLARTLSHNGAVFLQDVFSDRPGLAEAVNRLLVVGFYMLNLGYAFYVLRAERGIDGVEAVQFLVNRLALLLVTLALIHFINVAVFWKIRGRTEQRHMPPPVAAQVVLAAEAALAPPAVPTPRKRRRE